MRSPRRPTYQQPIRVLVADLPAVVYDIVAPTIRSISDLTLVGRVEGPLETLLAVKRGADVLVLGAARTSPAPSVCSQLLGEFPRLMVLVISFNGEDGRAYWHGLRARKLKHVSPHALVNEIRGSRNLS